jgi:hypothetical protein
MSERDASRPSTPALPPPPPSPGEGTGPLQVPPLDPPPSSLGALASRRKNPPPREPKIFWVLLVALFVAGTLLTFYLQKPK